jgi:two-component system, NarL family, response regulator LiaR
VGSSDGEASRPAALRAIVADDDPFARSVIKAALRRAGIVVVAEARDGREAIELTLHYRPDVVLMDVMMPEVDGISATRQIVEEAPDQAIVVLSSTEDDDVGMMSLRAGATGFLTKTMDPDALPRALRGVLGGEAAISRRLTLRLVDEFRRASEGAAGMRPIASPLTSRQWEVIDLLAEGKSTDQIAQSLVLSSETVRSHVKNILRKLGATSREEALAAARRLRGERGP